MTLFLSATAIKNITFNFSSDFETLFTKHSPCEILGLNFEKKGTASLFSESLTEVRGD